MRRAFIILAVLLALPVLLLGGVVLGLETGAGQNALRAAAERFGGVRIAAIEGSPFRATRISGIELQDDQGAWLRIERVELAWSPLRLLSRHVEVAHLRIAGLGLRRLPAAAAETPAEEDAAGGDWSSLPVSVAIRELSVTGGRIDEAVAGEAIAFGAEGSAEIGRDLTGTATLTARDDAGGRYDLALTRTDVVSLKAELREPANGLIARIAQLPDLGALTLTGSATGDPRAARTRLDLAFTGGVAANAEGVLALEGDGNDLAVQATAQGAALRAVLPPDVALASVTATAKLRGVLAQPTLDGTVELADVQAAGAGVSRVAAQLGLRPDGTGRRFIADVTANGVSLPPGLPLPPLGDAPLTLTAAGLLAVDGSIALDRVALAHALLNAEANGHIAGETARLRLSARLPDLRPFAAANGLEAAGAATLEGDVTRDGARLGADATLRLSGAELPAPLGDLLGDAPVLAVRGGYDGATAQIDDLTLNGQALAAKLRGTAGERLDLAAEVDLPVLAALNPALSGQARVTLAATGPAADPDARLTLSAPSLSVEGMGDGKLDLTAEGRSLLSAPQVTAQGSGAVGDRPIAIDVRAAPRPDGSIDIPALLARFGPAELSGSGSVTADHRPDVRLSLTAPDLAGVAPGLAGAVEATLVTTPDEAGGVTARLEATGRDIDATGNRVGRLTAKATVTDAMRAPGIDAEVTAGRVAAGGLAGDLTAAAKGTLEALDLKIGFKGHDLALETSGQFAMPGTLRIAQLTARVKGEPIRLASPTTITLGPPIRIEPVALTLRGGRIDAQGTVGDTLALRVAIRRLPLALASLAAPDLALAGTLDAEADIGGTPAAPSGTARVTVRGARMTTGPAATLPAASLDASLRLAEARGTLEATLRAGNGVRLRATAEGRTDLAGPVRATLDGPVDLALLDPILSPEGRRARGTLTFALRAEGPLPVPALSGEARLSGASVTDDILGLKLTNMAGTIRARGDTLEIADLTARAGAGTLAVRGTVQPLAPGLPVDMTLTARDADLNATDMATIRFGGTIAVAGQAAGEMRASGQLDVSRAEIRLPDRMPASVVDLPVREINGHGPTPATAAAAPAPAASPIALDIAVNAPRAVFVRGMGVDAEAGGNLRVAGTANAPDITGVLELRRGTLSVLTQTMTFRSGRIDFDGGQGIDPALDLVAATQAGDVTAIVTVGGTARAPKITLSGEPDMPQDEVLARLLFGRSRATLTPFQAIQIAQAAAELAGVISPGGSTLDRLRRGLGLDRLSVGSDESTGKASVEAGRYLADGVYLGARQGADGSPQATVQIEVLPNVKVEADVGGEGTGRAGLSWGFDY